MRTFPTLLLFAVAVVTPLPGDMIYNFSGTTAELTPATFSLTVPGPPMSTGAVSLTPDWRFLPSTALSCTASSFFFPNGNVCLFVDFFTHQIATFPSDAIGLGLVGVEELYYFPPGAFDTPGVYSALPGAGLEATLTVSGTPSGECCQGVPGAIPSVPEPSLVWPSLLAMIASVSVYLKRKRRGHCRTGPITGF